jgi:hypothetical protein
VQQRAVVAAMEINGKGGNLVAGAARVAALSLFLLGFLVPLYAASSVRLWLSKLAQLEST